MAKYATKAAATPTTAVATPTMIAFEARTRARRGWAANELAISPEAYSLPMAMAPMTAATIAPIAAPLSASATMSLSPPPAVVTSVVDPEVMNIEKPTVRAIRRM